MILFSFLLAAEPLVNAPTELKLCYRSNALNVCKDSQITVSLSQNLYERLGKAIDYSYSVGKRIDFLSKNINNMHNNNILLLFSALQKREKYASDNLSAQSLSIDDTADSQNPTQRGILFYDDSSNTIVVAYRGALTLSEHKISEKPQDILKIFTRAVIDAQTQQIFANVKVHEGILNIVRNTRTDLKEKISNLLEEVRRKYNKNPKFMFTGHGQGAAIAGLSAAMLSYDMKELGAPYDNNASKNMIQVYGFSMPKFFDSHGVAWMKKHFGEHNFIRQNVHKSPYDGIDPTRVSRAEMALSRLTNEHIEFFKKQSNLTQSLLYGSLQATTVLVEKLYKKYLAGTIKYLSHDFQMDTTEIVGKIAGSLFSGIFADELKKMISAELKDILNNELDVEKKLSTENKILVWILRAYIRSHYREEILETSETSHYKDFGYLAKDYYDNFDPKTLCRMMIGDLLNATEGIAPQNFSEKMGKVAKNVAETSTTWEGPFSYLSTIDTYDNAFNNMSGAFEYTKAICKNQNGDGRLTEKCHPKDVEKLLSNAVVDAFKISVTQS